MGVLAAATRPSVPTAKNIVFSSETLTHRCLKKVPQKPRMERILDMGLAAPVYPIN